MEREQNPEQEHSTTSSGDNPIGRTWTTRLTGPIRYRRFTDTDAGGRRSIFFKFELAPGQSDLPQPVYDILNQMKHMNRASGSRFLTSLQYTRDKNHGRVWRLADHEVGRMTADIIDAKLRDLAYELENDQGKAR